MPENTIAKTYTTLHVNFSPDANEAKSQKKEILDIFSDASIKHAYKISKHTVVVTVAWVLALLDLKDEFSNISHTNSQSWVAKTLRINHDLIESLFIWNQAIIKPKNPDIDFFDY